ncbi:MAG: hypothetical protein JWO98_241 [Frankiales bacterium]|nr:hypothetical protein [Frankiales bacterium]
MAAVDEPAVPAVSGDGASGTGPVPEERELAILTNEFASVRVLLDTRGNGPRLLIEDLEDGARIWLSPLELASLCLASPEDRVNWLRVGLYRDERT